MVEYGNFGNNAKTHLVGMFTADDSCFIFLVSNQVSLLEQVFKASGLNTINVDFQCKRNIF